jgi:hypothetical protein
MNPDRGAPNAGEPNPGGGELKPGLGWLGVMLRCIGCAEGAVRVLGGAEKVILPRLPNELPLPALASATAGNRASDSAARLDSRRLERRIRFRFVVVTA